jgi:hypothetical protein
MRTQPEEGGYWKETAPGLFQWYATRIDRIKHTECVRIKHSEPVRIGSAMDKPKPKRKRRNSQAEVRARHLAKMQKEQP